MKYIDVNKLKEKIYAEDTVSLAHGSSPEFDQGCHHAFLTVLSFIDSLQQELDSHSIPVLRADTTEKQDRILEIIEQDETYCHFPLDFGKETDCGYEDYNDRVYIDGVLTFNKMAEIVDFLSKNSK